MLSRIQRKDLFLCFNRIIQQLVNGIIAPTAMPNMGMGPWYVNAEFTLIICFI